MGNKIIPSKRQTLAGNSSGTSRSIDTVIESPNFTTFQDNNFHTTKLSQKAYNPEEIVLYKQQQDLAGWEIFLEEVGYGNILEVLSIDDDKLWTMLQLKDGRKVIAAVVTGNHFSSSNSNHDTTDSLNISTSNKMHLLAKLV